MTTQKANLLIHPNGARKVKGQMTVYEEKIKQKAVNQGSTNAGILALKAKQKRKHFEGDATENGQNDSDKMIKKMVTFQIPKDDRGEEVNLLIAVKQRVTNNEGLINSMNAEIQRLQSEINDLKERAKSVSDESSDDSTCNSTVYRNPDTSIQIQNLEDMYNRKYKHLKEEMNKLKSSLVSMKDFFVHDLPDQLNEQNKKMAMVERMTGRNSTYQSENQGQPDITIQIQNIEGMYNQKCKEFREELVGLKSDLSKLKDDFSISMDLNKQINEQNTKITKLEKEMKTLNPQTESAELIKHMDEKIGNYLDKHFESRISLYFERNFDSLILPILEKYVDNFLSKRLDAVLTNILTSPIEKTKMAMEEKEPDIEDFTKVNGILQNDTGNITSSNKVTFVDDIVCHIEKKTAKINISENNKVNGYEQPAKPEIAQLKQKDPSKLRYDPEKSEIGKKSKTTAQEERFESNDSNIKKEIVSIKTLNTPVSKTSNIVEANGKQHKTPSKSKTKIHESQSQTYSII